jgi:hypothetical protein
MVQVLRGLFDVFSNWHFKWKWYVKLVRELVHLMIHISLRIVFGIWLYFYIMSSVSCRYTRRFWSLPGVPKSQQQYFKWCISLRSIRTNKGVLCFQNVIEFHNTGLNMISFTPIRKERPSLHQFSRNSQTPNSVIRRLHQISRKSDN